MVVTPFDPVVEHERHGQIRVKPHVKDLMEKNAREACPQRTKGWYEKRRKHLTASQIASAVGDNPYENRLTAIRKKVGLEPGFTGNAATEHGNKYEDVAIGIYEQRSEEKVIEFGLLESIKYKHKGEDVNTSFLAGSPDGITASGRLIEVKCPFRRKPNGVVPGHYVHQIQTLMHILDLPVCDFIEYVPAGIWTAEIFSVVTVYRCDVFWEKNFPILQRFWNEVLSLQGEIEMHGIEYADEKTKPPPKRTRKKKLPPPPVCEISVDSENMKEEEEEDRWPLPKDFAVALQSKLKEISS